MVAGRVKAAMGFQRSPATPKSTSTSSARKPAAPAPAPSPLQHQQPVPSPAPRPETTPRRRPSSSPAPPPGSGTKGGNSFARSFGVYFPRSSAQVQPARAASAPSTGPEAGELARLVEELQERESRLRTELLEHKILKETVVIVPFLETELAAKSSELGRCKDVIARLQAENARLRAELEDAVASVASRGQSAVCPPSLLASLPCTTAAATRTPLSAIAPPLTAHPIIHHPAAACSNPAPSLLADPSSLRLTRPAMHRAMRLRCLLRPPPVSLGTPATVGGGTGRFSAPDGARRLGAPHQPFSERGRILRFYSSKEEDVGSAEAAAGSGGGSGSGSNQQEHARLGEKDQQEWLSGERFLTGCKRRESPFLTKRERFRNEFLRRVVPWQKSSLTWSNFPYYVDKNARHLLTECVASHLRNKDATLEYGSRLQSSGGRILLQSLPGTELYRERLVRALAHELRVPLLVLDSSVLAPYDNGEDCSETEEEDGHAESEDEGSGSEVEDEDYDEAKSGESDDDEVVKSVEDLRKLVPRTIEEFAKRVGAQENSSAAESTTESPEEEKRPLQKGDRVKYVGASVLVEADNRIILGKIPTQEGAADAYTFISGRTLSNGQRGEIYEINGDQVAVIFDPSDEKLADGKKDEANEDVEQQDAKSSVYWVDTQDIAHDHDTQAEDWHIAIEAFCEALPSLQPAIVYFPDSSQWLSRAVPRSKRREFIEKVEEMFDQLNGPLVLICGQNILEAAPKDKDPKALVFHNLSRLSPLTSSLRRLVGGLKGRKPSKSNGITKLFGNRFFIPLPKDDEQLRVLNNQIEEDKKIIISRHNLVEVHKVLEEHGLSCENLLHVKLEGIILTKQRAEKVIGWARSHYLSSATHPSIKGDKLVIPRESLELAIKRLMEQEASTKKLSENMKMLAKDEFERNFISAVVPPHEIGVKFDDIGALEDVKETLDELVTLPMRRPELFSRGNLLRPCKGILLFGPPGTGKTLLAKALATEAGANFISITGSSLTSKWFGDAEKLTKALFSFASRLAPVIIFVDEVDSLLGARGGAMEHEATRRMRNEFMAAWDGLRSKESQRILILGATNRPFDLDDAVIRRLPRRIYVDLPDAQNRMKILKVLLAKENLESEFGFDELANATEGYSGSDLKNLCIAAAYRPVHELLEEEKKGTAGSTKTSLRSLKLDDFIQAKAKVSPSVSFDATSMNELRKWNEQYGEGGSRSKSPFGFGS